ncbi:MAG: hypothetical protein ACO1NS_02075 [Daejeonella sp.]
MLTTEHSEYPKWSSYRFETVCEPWELSTSEEKVTIMDPIRFDPLSPLTWKVDQFNAIKLEKWDDADYLKPVPATFNNVKGFLVSVGSELLLHLRPEDLDITSYGTFTLDFYFGKDLISIEIGKDKIGYYSKSDKLQSSVLTGVYFDGDSIPTEISSAFEKFRQ